MKVLNRYHRPFAKEIHDSSICGETHPALENLQYKSGLSRPTEEYQELRLGTHEGNLINPFECVVARNDRTIWIGSTPNSIGHSSN